MADFREERTIADRGRGDSPPRSVRLLAGRHRVLALLGAGGMGSVFLAKDEELDELVAVKMLHTTLADTEALERFRSEVRLARRVTHTNVARTYDIGEHDGERFLTMEYIDGESLGVRLDRVGVLDLPYFLYVSQATVAGLAAAHQAGVVHRDLKPGNIMLGRGRPGRVVLTDFGIAAPREADGLAEFAGTPAYMAPEQFTGHADERSDVYALGLVFYRALTGQRAFSTNHPRHRSPSAPPANERRPDLPDGLSALITKCLELLPQNRFGSACDVRDALGGIAGAMADAPAPAAVAAPIIHRVFRDVDVDPRTIFVSSADEPFASGLRDAIIDLLNEHPVVRATRDGDRSYEVRAMLEVLRSDDGVHLGVRLVGSREGFEFWSESFAANDGQFISLAAAAAQGIAKALAVSANEGDHLPPLAKKSVELYLGGRAELRGFWPEHLRRAETSFVSALELAPEHPLLLAALATTRARQSFFLECSPEDARSVAERALRAAPNLAEAHVARAALHHQDNDASAALSEILHALTLAPGLAEAHDALSRILLDAGSPASAIRAAEIALRRDPSLQAPCLEIVRAHALLGRWDQSAAALDALGAGHGLANMYRVRLALWRRDVACIESNLRPQVAPDSRERAFYELCAGALAGRVSDVYVAIRGDHPEMAGARRFQSFARQIQAEIHAYVGDQGGALAALEQSVEAGLPDVLWFDRCPLLDELRGLRRFESLREIVHARARKVLARFEAADIAQEPPAASPGADVPHRQMP